MNLHEDKNSGSSSILTRLPAVERLTRYCSAEEIGEVIRKVRSSLAQDEKRLADWNSDFASLSKRIDTVPTPELRQMHDHFNQIEMERFLLLQSVPTLHKNCTRYRDEIVARSLLLVAAEMESDGCPLPDIPFSLISMGSDGREEQTLITDQDYLIVYGDGGGEAADTYFTDFSLRLVDRLEEAGFKKCTGDIMPSNPTWRGSYSQWRKRLLSIVRYEFEDYAKNMMDLIVLSDARHVAGDRNLALSFVEMVRDMEADHFRVLWGMARAATEMKLALGFMKKIWVEGSGEHRGEFNLKLLAWAPLVMNVRILAINQNIPATSTVERLRHLKQEGSLSAAMAKDLQDAYYIFTKHRILLQIRQIKGIQNNSHFLDPHQLPTEERERLRHGIMKVEELQKLIHTNFNIV